MFYKMVQKWSNIASLEIGFSGRPKMQGAYKLPCLQLYTWSNHHYMCEDTIGFKIRAAYSLVGICLLV